jgi:hypothetical protein
MKRYQSAMEHCAPPEGLEQRLRQAVLAVEPPETVRVFRPRGFLRKTILAAVLAALLLLSAGAALYWDTILTDRFGEDAQDSPTGQAAFQAVSVSSTCGDVTLTVTHALASDETIYLVLDYRLPDTVDPDWLAALWVSEDARVHLPTIACYATGDVDWAALRAEDADIWADVDWTDADARSRYLNLTALRPYAFGGSGSQETRSRDYDPDSRTLSYLVSFSTDSGRALDGQPLTLLVLPPWAEDTAGTKTPLADHPAILSFQPEYISQTWTGSWQDPAGEGSLSVTLSPFTIRVESRQGTYEKPRALLADTALVFRDGSVTPVRELVTDLGGSSASGAGSTTVSFDSRFRELLDVTEVKAVQVGDITVPVEKAP